MPYAGRFDGFNARTAAVSKTCLVTYDKNKYSVMAQAVGRPVEVHAYAERITIRQDGQTVADHPRCFGREQTVYDPWHYVPVFARKPGALRNGAPFKVRVLPGALGRVQNRLYGSADGDRQMVAILNAVLLDGLTGWGVPARAFQGRRGQRRSSAASTGFRSICRLSAPTSTCWWMRLPSRTFATPHRRGSGVN